MYKKAKMKKWKLNLWLYLLIENQEEIVKEGKAVIIEEDGAVIVNSPNSFQMKKDLMEQIQNSENGVSEMARSASVGKSKSMNLNYEFSLINVSEKLNVVAQDARERLFTVSAVTEKNVLILHVKFPPNYPNQKAPRP